jgi:hypothetical protein
LIEPITQGDYDGLCGLYCVINAVRLVLAPRRELTHEEVKTLFAAGVRFLARRSCLAEAVHSCIPEHTWVNLAKHVVAAAQPMTNRRILLRRPKSSENAPIEETMRRIERMVHSGQAPCVFLRGTYRHYSVISGYTPVSLKLFDSFGYRWVLRRTCGTTNRPEVLHRLHMRSLMTPEAGCSPTDKRK